MKCKVCNEDMRRFGQIAICGNKSCKQYGVQVPIGD